MAKAKNIFTPGKIKIATYIEDHNIDELTLKLFARIIEKITENESIELFDIQVFYQGNQSEKLNELIIHTCPYIKSNLVGSEVNDYENVLANILHAHLFIATNNLFSHLIAQMSKNIVLVPDAFHSTLLRENKQSSKCFPYAVDGDIDKVVCSDIEELLSIGAFNPFPSGFLLENKIPLLIYYSDAHKVFYDNHFKPSFDKYLNSDFDLIKKTGEQICSVEFRQGGWNAQVKEKVVFFFFFLQHMDEGFVLFSDVDIVVLDNFKEVLIEEIGSFDMVFQNDGYELQRDHNLCTGFYLVKINKRTKVFFENLVANYDDKLSDQQNMNVFLATSNIRYKALSKRFYNFSYGIKQLWHPGKEIPFPTFSLLIYHANYTLGNSNKQILLHEFTKWHNETVLPLLDSNKFEVNGALGIEDAIELSNEINKTQCCNILLLGNNEGLEMLRFINRNGFTFHLVSLDDEMVRNIPADIQFDIVYVNYCCGEDSSFLAELSDKLKNVIDNSTLVYCN